MKNKFLRILIRAIIFSFICGIVVTIIGLFLRWKTYTQFSDGFFGAGAIAISIGFINYMGRLYQGSMPRLQNNQSAVQIDPTERFKLWEADMTRGYNLLAFLGISGALLVGLSYLTILVGRLF